MIKLPLAKPPSIGYLDYAYSFSIMLTNESTFPWFYSNFIQLFFNSENKIDPLRFVYFDHRGYHGHWHAYFPFLDYKIIPREMFTRDMLDLNGFIKNWIELDNYYIITALDEFYIPGKKAYGNFAFPHAVLIFGCDDDGVFIAGFDENMQYTNHHINWQHFKNAFLSNSASDYYMRNIQLIDHHKWQEEYPLDLVMIKNQLTDYLYANKTSENYRQFLSHRETDKYGIEVYEEIKNYYLPKNPNEHFMSVKPIHLFWEHKKIMAARVEYLGESNCLSDCEKLLNEYKLIEKKALVCRNLFIKYQLTKQDRLLDKIIYLLDELYKNEKVVLQSVIDNIKVNKVTMPNTQEKIEEIQCFHDYNSDNINSIITRTSPGNYELGYTKNNTFIVQYVGRADHDLKSGIKDHLLRNRYFQFRYNYTTTPKIAFEKECTNYHVYGESELLDNKIHPELLNGTNWKCLQCKIFG